MPRALRAPLYILLAFALLTFSHFQLLRLPFYWDELGQFVPASLDLYHRLAWVPFTTVPNVHPPGVMAWLALTWTVLGYSIPATRLAMLFLAAASLAAQWRLARTLSGATAPAWMAAAFLFCCPLFFAQAEMAQLDMPAMLFTTVALILFLEDRLIVSALVCCVAVLVKETAIAAPALFGFLLLREKRIGKALLFTAPLAPLLVWLIVLHHATGDWLGNHDFADYNLFYPLNPVRLSLALIRRIYYLLIGSGHIIGTVALILWIKKRPDARLPRWRVACLFVAVHVILISVLGGAVLERYLLPALPVLYSAFAAAFFALRPKRRNLAAFALAACLLIACVVNPLYPFPFENNLAWTTFVELQKQASAFTAAAYPHEVVATSFPYAGGLRRPELGYVRKPVHVLEINDFRKANLAGPVRAHADVLICYTTAWDPFGLLNNPAWLGLITNFYGYVPPVPPAEIPAVTGFQSTFRLCGSGQCVEVFRKPNGNQRSSGDGGELPTVRDPDR